MLKIKDRKKNIFQALKTDNHMQIKSLPRPKTSEISLQ